MRSLNGIGKARRLRGGKRYLVYRSPHEGTRLRGGVLMPDDRETFYMQRPERGWGTPLTVDLLRMSVSAVERAAPLGTQLVIGDLSRAGGGCLPPHRSHRGGLDVDIGYYFRGGDQHRWMRLATAATLDADRTWLLLEAFVTSGRLQYAFIDYDLQRLLHAAALRSGRTAAELAPIFQYPRPLDQARSAIIRHLKGHADHMHVRFTCPPSGPCVLADGLAAQVQDVHFVRRGGARAEDLHGAARSPTSRPSLVRRWRRSVATAGLLR